MTDPATKTDLQATFADLRSDIDHVAAHLEAKLEIQALKLTINFGVMLAVAIAVFATILKLT